MSGRKKVNQKCSPCFDDGITRKAAKFCVQCKTALCDVCLRKHKSLFKKHDVHDFWREEVQAAIILPTEMCKDHSEVVGLYCQQHDKIGCSTCIALNHR